MMATSSDTAAAPQVATPVEIRIRVISAILIVFVVGFAVVAFYVSASHLSIDEKTVNLLGKVTDDKTRTALNAQLLGSSTTIAGMYGAFTTFLGTALGAYFGISAASSSVRTLSTAIDSSTAQVKTLAGSNASLQSDNATLKTESVAQQQKIDTAHKTLSDLVGAGTAVAVDTLKSVQTTLKPA